MTRQIGFDPNEFGGKCGRCSRDAPEGRYRSTLTYEDVLVCRECRNREYEDPLYSDGYDAVIHRGVPVTVALSHRPGLLCNASELSGPNSKDFSDHENSAYPTYPPATATRLGWLFLPARGSCG